MKIEVQRPITEEQEEALKRVIDYLSEEANDFLALSPRERRDHIFTAVLKLRTVFSPLFDLGLCVITPGAVEALKDAEEEPSRFLSRHEAGDWGEPCRDDWEANEAALRDGSRLLSIYRTSRGVKLWVITEWDRSATTILLPEEY